MFLLDWIKNRWEGNDAHFSVLRPLRRHSDFSWKWIMIRKRILTWWLFSFFSWLSPNDVAKKIVLKQQNFVWIFTHDKTWRVLRWLFLPANLQQLSEVHIYFLCILYHCKFESRLMLRHILCWKQCLKNLLLKSPKLLLKKPPRGSEVSNTPTEPVKFAERKSVSTSVKPLATNARPRPGSKSW